ncbi:MAG: TraB/GumN family protein [Hyphomonadaceae bacterium]|nr:TraB/GumN family protein [Hyphomonadaceae bacterium]
MMMKFIQRGLVVLLASISLLNASPTSAQTNSTPATQNVVRNANPALWVVRDADTTIYLFGTIHLLPDGINWNQGAVKAAFESADTLQLEIANIEAETPAIQAAMAQRGLLPPNQKLSDGLTPALLDQLDRVEKEAGLPPKALDSMRPWLASTVLAISMVQKWVWIPIKASTKVLDGLARARNMPVNGFETGAEHD